jgi:hypothetical protein
MNAADPLPTLRARLEALRSDALAQLAEADYVDAGLLAIVAHVTATLAAIAEAEGGDAEEQKKEEVEQ